MALTKEVVIDKIEVLETGHVQIRQATKILEDGELISRDFHRRVIDPNTDISEEDTYIQTICNAKWETLPTSGA